MDLLCDKTEVGEHACGWLVKAVFPERAGGYARFYGPSGVGLSGEELDARPLQVEAFPTEGDARRFMEANFRPAGDGRPDGRTWYEVSVVIGGLPPGLRPVQMTQVEKFGSEAEALEWAGRFRGFLGSQRRTASAIEPTDEEIEFLGGNHCAIAFNGVTERTEGSVRHLMTDEVECPECRGTGDVMTRDTGVCGAEEYGTCRKCGGGGRVATDPKDRRIAWLEGEVRRLGSPEGQ